MKKLVVVAAVVFLGSVLTSCKSTPHCQAYSSKVEKIKTVSADKPI